MLKKNYFEVFQKNTAFYLNVKNYNSYKVFTAEDKINLFNIYFNIVTLLLLFSKKYIH